MPSAADYHPRTRPAFSSRPRSASLTSLSASSPSRYYPCLSISVSNARSTGPVDDGLESPSNMTSTTCRPINQKLTISLYRPKPAYDLHFVGWGTGCGGVDVDHAVTSFDGVVGEGHCEHHGLYVGWSEKGKQWQVSNESTSLLPCLGFWGGSWMQRPSPGRRIQTK